jgi:hypothetical protein
MGDLVGEEVAGVDMEEVGMAGGRRRTSIRMREKSVNEE